MDFHRFCFNILKDTTLNGIYRDGALNIVISDGATLTISGTGYGIYSTGAITINGPGKLNIEVTAGTVPGAYDLKYYGIYANTTLKIGETTGLGELTVKVDATTTQANGNYSAGLYSKGAMVIDDTKATVYAGNRAIHSYSTIGITGTSDVTAGAYEKAIRGSNTLTLSNEAKLNAVLIDGQGVNGAGDDERFAIKVNDISVAVDSILSAQGMRITKETAITAPAGKIIVSAGYDQQCPAVMNIAGLYLDTAVASDLKAVVGTKTTAEVGKITITSDAQTYNIAIDGKSSVTTIDAPTVASDANTTITSALDDANTTDVQITIPTPTGTASGDDDKKITISNLKGKNVTLIIPNDADKVKALEVTLKDNESITVQGYSGVTYTFNNSTTNSMAITGFTGSIIATPGSVDVEIIGTGTLSITGDGKVSGTVTNDTIIKTTDNVTTPANVDLSGVTITSGTLTLSGINVRSSEYIVNGGIIAFTNNTTIDGSIFVNGGKISGTIDNGNLVLKNTVDLNNTTTITTDGKIVISKGSILDMNGNAFTNNGTINLSGIIKNDVSTATFTNDGKVVLLDKDASISSTGVTYAGTGIIDSSAIASDVQISGDVETVTTYGLYQIVTITGDVTLLKGTAITINGKLIINDGVTVTIEDGAQLIIDGPAATMENNGTIIVESDVSSAVATDLNKKGERFSYIGGLVLRDQSVSTNNGAIVLSYALLSTDGPGPQTSMTVSAKLINYGTLTVGENNKLDNGTTAVAIENKADGSITVTGQIYTINNAGTVVIDGIGSTISNIADGATVTVISTKGDLTVNDTGFMYGKTAVTGTNSFAITIGNATSVGSYTVTSEVTKTTNDDGTITYGKKMLVAGAVTETNTAASSPHASARVTGTVNISGEVTIGDDVVISGETLKVSGTLTAKLGTQITVDKLTVTGEVVVGERAVSATTVNAAMYKVVIINPASTTYYYSTLDKAIAGATKASVNEVTATGDVSVKANIEIPAGMTVKQTSGKITVGSSTATDVTMTVAKDGKINQTSGATIDVKGTLYITDKKTGINRGATVTCEVIAEGETDLRYTNFNSAIAAAGTSPVTITLNGQTKITSDSVIPENVTIDMNGQKFIVEGAKLTINGTLYVDEVSNYDVKDVTSATSVTKKGVVVLNGYIVSDDPISYNANTGKSPAGVYYIADSLNIITSINNIADAVTESDDLAVSVYGENVIGDVAISGTADEPATVTVYGKLTAGKITLDYVNFIMKQNVEVTATVANANGSIAFNDVKAFTETKIVANENTDKVKTLTVDSGTVTKISDEKAKTYALVMDGDVLIKALNLDSINVTGENIYSLTVDGNVKVTGSSNDLKKVLVNGTLTADNGVTIVASQIDVIGTLTAEKATETKTAGAVSVAGNITVGSKWADIGAAATVSGAVSFYTLFVIDGNNVEESIVKDLKSTKFYVEGAVWMTAYASATATSENITDIEAINQIPIEDAFFTGKWVIDLTQTPVSATTGDVGSVAAVYAVITYEVYKITVVGDNGIGTVSIDGNLLVKSAVGQGDNVFTTPSGTNLKAGNHEITYELKDGYEGTVKIKVDGELISGKTFKLSGTPTADTGGNLVPINVTIDISGSVQKDPVAPIQPTEKDEGMGITDYLLIVLVILAAILVVIVAIRMMRS